MTADATVVLTTIGLGSCVGVALLDPRRHVAGLAHAMFPQAPQSEVDQPGRYADTAVSALLAALAQFGSKPSSLTAVLTGGARMFSFVYSGDSDIGTRNVAATRGALAAAGVPIAASATGGSTGRSIRVHAAAGIVRLREAGSDRELYRPAGTGAAVGGAS